VAAYAAVERAVEAMRIGVFDYLAKPIDLGELDIKMERAMRTAALGEVEQLNEVSQKKNRKSQLCGSSPAIQTLQEQLKSLAKAYPLPALITGETGTGNGVAASIIHNLNPVSSRRFLTINCAAIADTMFEAELFGHERGSFTGAHKSRKGIFELADSGTLVLDEIGELPINMQPKLLRILEDGLVRRIGGQVEREIHVRIIATTNRNIERLITQGKFREDLFFRLAVLPIRIPPLRERREDIPDLLQQFRLELNSHASCRMEGRLLARFADYHWPGNVRELRNVYERYLVAADGKSDFIKRPVRLFQKRQNSSQGTLSDVQREYIFRVLEQVADNRTAAARILGISRSTLKRKLKIFRMETSGSMN
jgi:DNA-binding NtrC family response regulator